MGKNALVLGGGGARGAYQIGVWRALIEEDWPIAIVCGSSVGALNAALIAQGDLALAEKLWLELRTTSVLSVELDEEAPEYKQMFQAFHNYLKGGAPIVGEVGLDASGLRKLMDDHLDEGKIRAAAIEMGLMTVLWKAGPALEHKALFLPDIPAGRLFDYMMGSASLYPAMKSYDIDGDKYIDGGYHDNLPINMAFEAGADFVLAVDISGPGQIHNPQLQKGQDMQVLGSYWPLGPMLLFENHWISRNLLLGYYDGKKAFGHYHGCYFTFTGPAFVAPKGKEGRLLTIRKLLGREGRYVSLFQNNFDRWVRKKYQGHYMWQRDLPSIMAEAAGEVFDLDPLKVYSTEDFLLEIKTKLGDAVGENSEKLPGWGDNIEKALSPLRPQGRALYFRNLLEAGARGRPALGAAISLATREFLAGAFLYLFDLWFESFLMDDATK